MNMAGMIVTGGLVALLWLTAAFFDRVARWRTPWDRWAMVRPSIVPILKIMALGFAGVASIAYAFWVARVVTG